MQPVGASPPSGYQWVEYWADEFGGTEPDSAVWTLYDNTYGAREHYNRPQNWEVSSGTCRCVTKRESFGGKSFTTGTMGTREKGVYFPRVGFYEMRCRTPHGQGTFPAFWLRHRNGSSTAECDIMETFHSQLPGYAVSTLHLPQDEGSNFAKDAEFVETPSESAAWHVYGCSIHETATGIEFRFYIDGALHLAVIPTKGSWWTNFTQAQLWDIAVDQYVGGPWIGHPDDALGYDRYRSACLQGGSPPAACDSTGLMRSGISTLHPTPHDEIFEIDYVRVWSIEEAPVVNRVNNFECESDEVSITAANSGCAPNSAFTSDITVTWGTAVYDSARFAHGAQSGRFSTAANSGASRGYVSSPTEPYGRAYLYLTANPPSNARFAEFYNVATLRLMLRVLSDGRVAITDAGFTNKATSTALPLNAWHRIEWRAATGTAANLVEVRIFSGVNMDGSTPDQTISAASMTVDAWDRMGFGVMFSSAQTYDWWIDDVGLSDTGWLGPAVTTTAVGKDLGLQWHTRAAVSDTAQLVWDTRQAVADTAQLMWNVRAAVADSVQLVWNVESPLTAVGKDLAVPWDVRAAIADDAQLVWATRQAVGDPLDLVWSALAVVGKDLSVLWDGDEAFVAQDFSGSAIPAGHAGTPAIVAYDGPAPIVSARGGSVGVIAHGGAAEVAGRN